MRQEINALKEERAGLIQEMRDLTLKAESEERDFTAEEAQEFDRKDAAVATLEKRASRMEKLTDSGWEPDDKEERQVVPQSAEVQREEEERAVPKSLKEFREQQRGQYAHDTDEYRLAWYKWISSASDHDLEPTELRVLSKASGQVGANLVPTEYQRTLIDSLRETGIMRQISRVITTDAGEALQVPAVSSHGTAAWTAESASYTASDDAFSLATLNAYKAATLIKVSEELLTDSAFDLGAYIRMEFGMRIGILENTAYVVGDGSGKPTGVTTQASAGVTAASTTAVTADELIDLYHSLLSPYRRNATFVVKDSTIKAIRKLKDTTNQYLWQPGLQAGAPDTLLGKPILTDPDMAAIATGTIAALFGDFSYYWIRDVNGIAFQRLNELYAENGQVGFRAYHRTDGKLLNTAAVKKLTLA